MWPSDTLFEVELIIGKVRNEQKSEQAEFITGLGTTREKLFNLLESYSLEPVYPTYNPGMIIVTIE
jgi:molecular chaperone GrpE (heat shock protein)